jgi:hypothetical protein
MLQIAGNNELQYPLLFTEYSISECISGKCKGEDSRLGGPHSWSGCGGKERNSLLQP